MTLSKAFILILLSVFWTSCQTQVNEEDKIFFAGAANTINGIRYFRLYKDNKYQFCEGDVKHDDCYTGSYSLSGDTIILHKLKKHGGIPTNRFLICRYKDVDSSYWQSKYPNRKDNWQYYSRRDSRINGTGDVLPLNSKGEIVFDINNYFPAMYIAFDEIKNNR